MVLKAKEPRLQYQHSGNGTERLLRVWDQFGLYRWFWTFQGYKISPCLNKQTNNKSKYLFAVCVLDPKLGRCLRVSAEVQNTDVKATWRRKGIIQFMFPRHRSSSKDFRTEPGAEQDPGGRRSCRGHGEGLLTGLLIMTCSARSLIDPRIRCPQMVPFIMDWAITP